MKYRKQPGIVMETICGQSLLIATIEAREYCPYLTKLDESSAFIWKMIEDGRTTDEMVSEIVREYGISKEEAEHALMAFLNGMEENHFIIKEV